MSCTRVRNGEVWNSLQNYMWKIKDESLLTAVEERDLAVAIAGGDTHARARLIRANLRLVVKVARDFVGRGLVLDDLVGEGNLGLIRAAEKFQPQFGTRFSTYACHWINESIRHALINTTGTIRVPTHVVRLLTKWGRAERALRHKRGDTPSFDEVASVLSLSEAQKTLVAQGRQAVRFTPAENVTLETGRRARGASWNLRDPSPDADDERCNLLQRIQRLAKRERTTLELRYGLEGDGPLTLKEIGIRMGVTRECVRKTQLRAIRKLGDDLMD
jgi:RNA polymerase primary sigma factor